MQHTLQSKTEKSLKNDLVEYANKEFSVSLDKRKTVVNMVARLESEVDDLTAKYDPESLTVEISVFTEAELEAELETETEAELETEDQSPIESDETEDQSPIESDEDQSPIESDEDQTVTEEFVLPEDAFDNFSPAWVPNFKNSARGFVYTNIGYWIITEMESLGKDWLEAAYNKTTKHHRELMTIAYYMKRHGKCVVRESSNSEFIVFKNV